MKTNRAMLKAMLLMVAATACACGSDKNSDSEVKDVYTFNTLPRTYLMVADSNRPAEVLRGAIGQAQGSSWAYEARASWINMGISRDWFVNGPYLHFESPRGRLTASANVNFEMSDINNQTQNACTIALDFVTRAEGQPLAEYQTHDSVKIAIQPNKPFSGQIEFKGFEFSGRVLFAEVRAKIESCTCIKRQPGNTHFPLTVSSCPLKLAVNNTQIHLMADH